MFHVVLDRKFYLENINFMLRIADSTFVDFSDSGLNYSKEFGVLC